MLMAENMRSSMYELQRIMNVIQEINSEYDRLLEKEMTFGLTEKDSAYLELLEHLSKTYHRGCLV